MSLESVVASAVCLTASKMASASAIVLVSPSLPALRYSSRFSIHPLVKIAEVDPSPILPTKSRSSFRDLRFNSRLSASSCA